ncbi:MAG: alkaline phosphatase [Lentisphaeria bacterium]|nr:alkaline phosphatase [Lentisphaeria bacterium]
MRILTGFLIGLLAAGSIGAAEFKPLDFTKGANTAFTDETPDDRQGGWTDQGSNDLRLLKPGTRTLSGVPFTILDDKATGGKSCVVLSASGARSYLPKQAEIEPAAPAAGKTLYLLHAGAWLNPKKNLAGRLTVKYTDGSSKEFRVRTGRDLADWWANSGAPNAVRVWTIYNNNSQISLYASKFPLDAKPVKTLRFDAGDDGVWMIAAASIGDSAALKPIYTPAVLKNDYPAPAPADPAELAKYPRSGTPKNIIFIIGDGMGQGAVKFAGLHAHGRPQTLVMEQLPVNGMAQTYSASSDVTDSAASGTALSSGYKTTNGFVGMTPEKNALRSIAEEARDSGRSVGIITTDQLTGATPAAFSAHVPSRGMAAEIAAFQAGTNYEILIGNGIKPFLPEAENGSRKDGRNLVSELQQKGYIRIGGLDEFRKAGKLPVFGFIDGWQKDTELLSQISAEAFNRLAANPKGFFIMIEGHFPDYGGHGNNPELSANGPLMVDFTVKAALDFAKRNNDTLIVVTADHETGGVHCAPNPQNPKRPFIHYMTKSHTGVPVPVYAFGPGADRFSGVVNNIDIPSAMAELWGLPLHRPFVK